MGQFRVGQKGVKWDKKRCRNCVRTINGRKKSNIHMGQFSAGTKIGRTMPSASYGKLVYYFGVFNVDHIGFEAICIFIEQLSMP